MEAFEQIGWLEVEVVREFLHGGGEEGGGRFGGGEGEGNGNENVVGSGDDLGEFVDPRWGRRAWCLRRYGRAG